MPDDNLPDEIYIVGKSIDQHADFEDHNCMWSHKPSWNECTKYHHTRQYTGLERDVERLHDYNTHLVNENERLRAALDLAYKMHCDPCNMPEKDIQQIEQALKETT